MSTREWVIEQAARLQFKAEKEKAAANLAKTMGWVERGVQNLRVSIDRVQDDTYDTELSLEDMPDKPKQFEVLKDAAPDNRPTLGFRARFWALNFSDGSGPAPLPDKIRTTLTKAFDRVASWAAEGLLASTQADAELIMQDARQRADHCGSKDAVMRQWHSFAELIKEKIRQNFGDDGYQQVADSVNEVWQTYEDNPNRNL